MTATRLTDMLVSVVYFVWVACVVVRSAYSDAKQQLGASL